MDIARLKETVAANALYVQNLRERLHAIPELGTEEHKTSACIVEALKAAGCEEIRTGIVHTGVLAVVRGEKPGPTIMLRVDMDALLAEDPASENHEKKPCHCCGHDVHTALGLGAAKIALENRDALCGTLAVFFQPSEERPVSAAPGSSYTEAPVGVRSASQAIEEGILKNPTPDRLLGIHCWPLLEAGRIGFEYGTAMAGTGNFHITVLGRSGHAGMPHMATDAIVVSAQLIEALQTLISRRKDPSIAAVMNIGTICGGVRRSVVCERVDMTGTVRALDPAYLSEEVPRIMKQTIEHVCAAMGAQGILEYGVDQPPVVNDTAFVHDCARVLKQVMGDRAAELRECPMTAEDFSFLSRSIPALYMKLGTAGGADTRYPLHNPHFDVDPACSEAGLLGICSLVFDYLGGLQDA